MGRCPLCKGEVHWMYGLWECDDCDWGDDDEPPEEEEE